MTIIKVDTRDLDNATNQLEAIEAQVREIGERLNRIAESSPIKKPGHQLRGDVIKASSSAVRRTHSVRRHVDDLADFTHKKSQQFKLVEGEVLDIIRRPYPESGIEKGILILPSPPPFIPIIDDPREPIVIGPKPPVHEGHHVIPNPYDNPHLKEANKWVSAFDAWTSPWLCVLFPFGPIPPQLKEWLIAAGESLELMMTGEYDLAMFLAALLVDFYIIAAATVISHILSSLIAIAVVKGVGSLLTLVPVTAPAGAWLLASHSAVHIVGALINPLVEKGVKHVMDWALEDVTNAREATIEALADNFQGLYDQVVDISEKAIGFAGEVGEAIGDGLGAIGDGIGQIGEGINQIGQGIGQIGEGVGDAIGNIGKGLWTKANHATPKVFNPLGAWG